MNPKYQSIIDNQISKGRTEEEILFAFGTSGANEKELSEFSDYIKKKSPSSSEDSNSQFSEQPSVSESLSTEYLPTNTSPQYIEQQGKEIARAAAADVYSGVLAARGDYESLGSNESFKESYNLFKNFSDDPAAKALPASIVENGNLRQDALPVLQYGAVQFANDYIKKEAERKKELGSKFTIPILSELGAGAESLIGGLLKFTEVLGSKDGGLASELGDFLISDGGKRANDALIDYGLTEEESYKSFIENFQEGNMKAGFATLGSALLQQIPQLIAVAYTGPAALYGLGASAAGSQYSQVQDRSDLTRMEKLLYATGVGAIEFFTEKLFLGDVNLLRRTLGKELEKGITKKQLGDAMFGWLPKSLRFPVEEGVEEIIATSSQGVLGKFIAGDEIDPIEIVESGIIGSLMGGGTWLAARGAGAIKNKEDQEKINNARVLKKDIQDHLQKTSVSKEEKDILSEVENKASELENNINSKYDQIANEMSEEDQIKKISLDNSLRKEKQKYFKLSSPIAKEAQKKKIAQIEKKISELQNKYDDSKKKESSEKVTDEKGQTIESQIVEEKESSKDVQESTKEKQLRESREDLILTSLIEDETFDAMDRGDEVEVSSIEKAQEKILKVIDDVSNSDMDQTSKDQYIETLENQFDKLENYDNKTITETKTVTERKKITTPKIVNQRSKRKSIIAKRIQNVEVTTGKENKNQISVIEVQDDGSVDIVTYSKKTKKEVNRQKKAAESVSDLQYSESVFDDNGNLIGVKLKKKRINQDEAELEVEININTSRKSSEKNNELIFEIALEGMENSLGPVPTFETRYEEVTREETTTEKVSSEETEDVSEESTEQTEDPVVEEPKIDEIFNDKEAEVKEAINKVEDDSRLGRIKKAFDGLMKYIIWNPAQKTVRMLKETLSGRLTNEGRRIKAYVSEMAELIRFNEEAGEYVNKIFDGTITYSEVRKLLSLKNGKRIAVMASAMRTYIDSLSKSLIDDPAFESLPQSTKDAILANIGSYVRGSYRFWKDKKYNPSQALINDAIEYEYNVLRGQAIAAASKPINGVVRSEEEINEILERDEPMLRENAKRAIDEYLAEIKNQRAGGDFQASGSVRSAGAKLPSNQFSKRKTLPETIEALLGKEKDPIIRFIDTTLALANIKYKGLFISEMLSSADKDAIKDEITKIEESEGLYKKINDEFSPLNGKYVRADLFEVISDEALYKSSNVGGQLYFDVLKLARKSKVIWNIPTWRKNLTGGWFTMIANGVLLNPNVIKDMTNRSKVLLGTAKGKDLLDKETTEFLEIMGEYGLLGSSVDANFMGLMDITFGSAFSGGISDGKLKTWLEKAGMSFKRFDKWSTENYSFVDDYTKLIIFREEIPITAKKLYGKEFESLNDSEKDKVYRFAAERVKASTPTFSRLPRFYKTLAKAPFGDFLGFELEAIRSFTSNIYYAIMDIKKGLSDKSLTDVQKSAYLNGGYKRMIGISTLLTFRIALASGLAAMALGDDEEIEEDVKELRPDWMAGHSLIPTKITRDGDVYVYDYSLEDPYGNIFDIGTSPQKLPNHIFELFGPNMAVEFISNILKGKDVYGRDIAQQSDNVLKSAYRYASYGAKQLIIPPFISSYYRDYIKKGEAENAIDYFSGLASRTTIRDYRYNVYMNFKYNAEGLRTKGEDYDKLSNSSKRVRIKDLKEIKKQYESIVNIGLAKENYKAITDANNIINRNFKPKERGYILYGIELK